MTGRGREVLALVARGLSNQDTATGLGIGLRTAKTHVGRLLAKPGAHDRARLVVAAYQSGLARP
ncbi:response regulator transcription factor [Prauserella endophytica]|uniref:response regulator transcription factor n=1 Tax=Prauserella endophytica TaxID=1592324 RepID=UPI00389AB78D